MIHLNINYTLKPENGTPELNAAYVASFIEALDKKGVCVNTTMDKPQRVASPTIGQKGPFEAQYIASRNLSRMKVPATWNGSREDYAKAMLESTVPVESETDSSEDVTIGGEEDENDILHK